MDSKEYYPYIIKKYKISEEQAASYTTIDSLSSYSFK